MCIRDSPFITPTANHESQPASGQIARCELSRERPYPCRTAIRLSLTAVVHCRERNLLIESNLNVANYPVQLWIDVYKRQERKDAVRFIRQRKTQLGERVGELPLQIKCTAQILMSLGELWMNANGILPRIDRLADTLFSRKHNAQIVVSLKEISIDANCLLKIWNRGCLLYTSQWLEGSSHCARSRSGYDRENFSTTPLPRTNDAGAQYRKEV